MNIILKGIAGAALISASSLALAVPTLGGISFSGIDENFSFDTSANTFSFGAGTYNGEVDSIGGDFTDYFSQNDQVKLYDFTYDPFVGPLTVWKGTATVGANAGTELEFILNNGSVSYENSDGVLFKGTGTLTDGVTDVIGSWKISANSAFNTFSWSASTEVPEPGTLALLGLGIAGLGAARRRQKA